MLSFKKTMFFVFMFSLMIQYGCASRGIHNKYGEKIEFSVDDLVEGNIRLVCGVNCSVKYDQMRDGIKKLHDNKAWLDLARQVSAIGYEIDQAYYYLGRSSEGLESYDAARTYYALALTAPKCGGFLDICNGFEFPRDIKARNILIVAAENAAALDDQKASLQEEKSNLTDEQILYEEVKKIPSKYVEKNRDGYEKLMDMSPSNQTYRKKYFQYKKLSESKSNTSYKEKSILTDEQILYEEVKKIPSKYVEKNRDGYKKLMDMNPSNQAYNEKYFHYKELSERKMNSYDKDIVTSSSIQAEISNSTSFAEALNNMEVAGAFTKDRDKASIYVETSFWNAMSSNQKDLFCYMLKTTYPMYAQSIQDKYSGRKLAETNIYGELAVIQ